MNRIDLLIKNYMTVKSLYQFFYYHSKYLNSMKCREISMGPSIHTIKCGLLFNLKGAFAAFQECYELYGFQACKF
jgi:hypothetical protein